MFALHQYTFLFHAMPDDDCFIGGRAMKTLGDLFHMLIASSHQAFVSAERKQSMQCSQHEWEGAIELQKCRKKQTH